MREGGENSATSMHIADEIQYVLSDPSDDLGNEIFADYYDEEEPHPTYQNI